MSGDGPNRDRMTMRVSRDGGRTWSRPVVVREGDHLPVLDSMTWPPCECPRCKPDRDRERRMLASLRAVNRRSRS